MQHSIHEFFSACRSAAFIQLTKPFKELLIQLQSLFASGGSTSHFSVIEGATIVSNSENHVHLRWPTVVNRLHLANTLHQVLFGEAVLPVRMVWSFLAEVHVLYLEAIDFMEADIVVVESTLVVAGNLIGELHERAHPFL